MLLARPPAVVGARAACCPPPTSCAPVPGVGSLHTWPSCLRQPRVVAAQIRAINPCPRHTATSAPAPVGQGVCGPHVTRRPAGQQQTEGAVLGQKVSLCLRILLGPEHAGASLSLRMRSVGHRARCGATLTQSENRGPDLSPDLSENRGPEPGPFPTGRVLSSPSQRDPGLREARPGAAEPSCFGLTALRQHSLARCCACICFVNGND